MRQEQNPTINAKPGTGSFHCGIYPSNCNNHRSNRNTPAIQRDHHGLSIEDKAQEYFQAHHLGQKTIQAGHSNGFVIVIGFLHTYQAFQVQIVERLRAFLIQQVFCSQYLNETTCIDCALAPPHYFIGWCSYTFACGNKGPYMFWGWVVESKAMNS